MDFWHGLILDRTQAVCPQLCAQIRKQIVSGSLENETRLPSRRETAAALEINPNTVQKAYKQLEDEGIIVTDGNLGSIVRCTEAVRCRLREDATCEMAAEFVSRAKELKLSYKQALDLISSAWETLP